MNYIASDQLPFYFFFFFLVYFIFYEETAKKGKEVPVFFLIVSIFEHVIRMRIN